MEGITKEKKKTLTSVRNQKNYCTHRRIRLVWWTHLLSTVILSAFRATLVKARSLEWCMLVRCKGQALRLRLHQVRTALIGYTYNRYNVNNP